MVRNESFQDCVVYHLSTRGLFAELSDLARAVIYASVNNLQLLIDSSRFSYRIKHGWEDWFEPFCRGASEVDPERIKVRFEFHPQAPDRKAVRQLQLFHTKELRLGEIHLSHFGKMLDYCQKMIFRPNDFVRQEIERCTTELSLPDNYYAIHLRRGDKIGDEDLYYPAEMYLQALPKLRHSDTIFVMSDEYDSLAEVEHALARRGEKCLVKSLVSKQDRGFDVNLLRAGQQFMARESQQRPIDGKEYLKTSTRRFLAEICIASRARSVTVTQRSYVGKALKALSGRPGSVQMLGFDQARNYSTSKLTPGRHILDFYKGVYLIRIGHHGAGFFAYVQYALNQIQYCERHGLLPVVHYDHAYGNHFYDESAGEDVWDYYFEPVAGYTKGDIDKMLADPDDPLTSRHIQKLSDAQIMNLCQFDPDSIFHYTYGYWRENPPVDPDAWYSTMRRKGHEYVASYIKVKESILTEVDTFFDHKMKGNRVLGVHIRGTDMRYAPPVPMECFTTEIDRQLDLGFDKVFIATDQSQYIEILVQRYQDRLIYLDCLRSTDANNPMWLADRSPAQQGKEVLVDTLLLSRCNFMLKCPSAVSEFAHYFWPMLNSLDLNHHQTEFDGRDYSMPGLGYGNYPNAWDVVGGGNQCSAGSASKQSWITPVVDIKIS